MCVMRAAGCGVIQHLKVLELVDGDTAVVASHIISCEQSSCIMLRVKFLCRMQSGCHLLTILMDLLWVVMLQVFTPEAEEDAVPAAGGASKGGSSFVVLPQSLV